MTIKVGEKIPSVTVYKMSADGPAGLTTDELFGGKRVAAFAVPGAFTPTCSAKHLPGFVNCANDLKGKGIDSIVCISVNDVFVMDAWGKDQNVGDKVELIADGSGDLTQALGLELDLSGRGLGKRSTRYSMLVEDGVVKALNVEDGGAFEVSSAEQLLEQL
jgi:peroxiredoxin